MKKVFLALILSATCSISCVSTKVSSKNNYDYSILNDNTKYIIETKDGEKIRHFQFQSQTNDLIIGKKDESVIEIKKNTINKIQRPSTGKTITLVSVIIALASIGSTIPSAVSNN